MPLVVVLELHVTPPLFHRVITTPQAHHQHPLTSLLCLCTPVMHTSLRVHVLCRDVISASAGDWRIIRIADAVMSRLVQAVAVSGVQVLAQIAPLYRSRLAQHTSTPAVICYCTSSYYIILMYSRLLEVGRPICMKGG